MVAGPAASLDALTTLVASQGRPVPRVASRYPFHSEALRPAAVRYEAALSADSMRSLALQGGVFSAEQAEAFMAQAGALDALRLRQWDDLAKTAGAATPPLQHFLQRAARCTLA